MILNFWVNLWGKVGQIKLSNNNNSINNDPISLNMNGILLLTKYVTLFLDLLNIFFEKTFQEISHRYFYFYHLKWSLLTDLWGM